jgi:flagellar motor switch protein FliM
MIAGSSRRRPEDGESVVRELNAIRVPIAVRLGTADVTVAELLGLECGDVIPLHTSVDREVEVLVKGQIKYLGRPGLKKHHLATRITSVVPDSEEHEALSSLPGSPRRELGR